MITIFIGLLLILTCLCLIYRLNFWKRKNVPSIPFRIYSNTMTPFYIPVVYFDYYIKIYNLLKGYKYGGSFWFLQPQFVIRDPELIKQILVRDFDFFHDRGSVFYDELDTMSKNLFTLPGRHWKGLRVRLAPIFTSGKMKYMFERVKDCAVEGQQKLEKLAASGKPINFVDFSNGYFSEATASTAFGWKINAINNPNTEFRKMCLEMFRRTFRFRLWQAFDTWLPTLRLYFKFYMYPKWPCHFFLNMLRETVEYRKKSGHKRNDFLQLLINLNEQENNENSENKKNGKHIQPYLKLTTEQMTALCVHFCLGGFHPTSIMLSLTLLEVAVNKDIQRKLQEEIDQAILQNGDQGITYQFIKDLPYLHKVLQESLRKYPVVPIISRICIKAYKVPGSNIVIEKGTEVIIPMAGIHRDETIYADPELYDPERFSETEIQKRHKFTYLPFGGGPRTCIGVRYGMMSVKLALVHILGKFNLEKTAETVYPMPFPRNTYLTHCKYPVILKCSPRS